LEDRAAAPDELDQVATLIDVWASAQLHDNDPVQAVEHGEPGQRRWYIRLAGEEKASFTIWFTLRQRSLFFETYVLPAPQENRAEFYEYLLRRNQTLHGMAFSIGDEDAIFLSGHVPVDSVDTDELDRIAGSIYAYVERFFGPALRIGFRSRFKAPDS
jgi:hypothetical protein